MAIPRAWAAMAAGMVVLVLWSGRDAGLTARQNVVLVVATLLLAAACAWIVRLEQ